MGTNIPSEAVGVCVIVLIYSFVCLALSTLVIGLLVQHGEKLTYVTLLCGFATINALGSIAELLHYALAWDEIRAAQYQNAVASLTTPALGFNGCAGTVDVILSDIQLYCYNVMALFVLFWSLSLFCGSWEIRASWLGVLREHIGLISKIFAIVFPAIVMALRTSKAIIEITALYFVVTNINMILSFAIGTIALILTLYKYMKTKRLLAGPARRGKWWLSSSRDRPLDEPSSEIAASTGSRMMTSSEQALYDRALVMRFFILFLFLTAFEVVVVLFNLLRISRSRELAATGRPDYSVKGAISDILFYVPGVSVSLVCYLVFGTTKSWRLYRDMLVDACSCGSRARMLVKRRAVWELGVRDPNNIPSGRSSQEALKDETRLGIILTETTTSSDETALQIYTSRDSGHKRMPTPLRAKALPTVNHNIDVWGYKKGVRPPT